MWDIDTWRTAAIASAAVGQTLFVAFYCTLTWWRTFLGKALFSKALVFAVLLDIAVVGRVTDWPHEQGTIVACYMLVSAGIWLQLAAFIRQARLDWATDTEATSRHLRRRRRRRLPFGWGRERGSVTPPAPRRSLDP